MDLERFLQIGEPSIFNEPCLYIIQQSPQAGPQPWPCRCGTSGTQLYQTSDLVYGSENAQFSGLLGRAVLYKNYWLPNKGTIYAALRVKRQLVAKPGARVEQDATGGAYSASGRANFTLVELREMEFHAALDERDLRWQKDRRNELFQAKKSIDELIVAMRTVKGEEMYLFSATKIREDPNYDPDEAIVRQVAMETQTRQQPGRTAAIERKAPVIRLRLNKAAIEELRGDHPIQYKSLIDLVKQVESLVDKPTLTAPSLPPIQPKPPPPRSVSPAPSDATTITLPAATIAAIRTGPTPAQRAAAAAQLVPLVIPRVTRAQTRAALLPRRSGRLTAR